MATTSILQFAPTDTGTNLMTDADYLAASARTNGNQPGVASSKLNNKALRQASLIAAGVAQLMADNQANNIVDTLTPAQIATYLSSALGAALTFPTAPQFDNDTSPATTEFVKRQGLQASGFNIVSAASTLTAAVVGSTVYLSGAGSYITTLPLAASVPAGARIEFLCGTSTAQTISRQGADLIWPGGPAGSATSMLVGLSDNLTLESNGIGWYAVVGSAQLGFSAAFAAQRATSGWQKLPGGLIFQWGAVVASTGWAWSFPMVFPNACLHAFATSSDTGPSFCTLYSASAASVFGNRWNTAGVGVNGSVSLLAIGY
jgi:hypothetical protein